MENKSIDQEFLDIMSQLSQQATMDAPANVEVPSTVETPVVPAQVPPVVEPKVEATPIETKPKPVDLNSVVDSWDVETTPTVPVETPKPVEPTVDFSDLAKVLGKEIKTKDELVEAINLYKQEAETQVLSALPQDLAKAVEIARLNGNYLDYLNISVVDWSKQDPVELYENYVIDQFTDATTGEVNYERVDRLLDKLDDDEKELRGKELQRMYVNSAAQQKAYIEQQARQQKFQFESTVKQSVDKMDAIAGFKLTPSHKAELYRMIVEGEDLKPKNVEQRIFNAFVTKYFSKVDEFRKQQIKNATLGGILEEATMPNIKPSTDAPLETPNVGYSLNDLIKEVQNKNRF